MKTKRATPGMSLADRIDMYVTEIPEAGCWIWTGACLPRGYGQITVKEGTKKRCRLAHRVAFEVHRGLIPPGLDLDHLCRTPSCVNPWHLEPVTRLENMRRSPIAKTRMMTHCRRGHPFDEANTGWKAIGRWNVRVCRRCAADRYQAGKSVAR